MGQHRPESTSSMLAATDSPASDPGGQAVCLQVAKFLNFRAALVAQTVKNPPAIWETWVRSLAWEGHGNPVQYSSLENPMDRGAWWATVHSVAESGTTEVT